MIMRYLGRKVSILFVVLLLCLIAYYHLVMNNHNVVPSSIGDDVILMVKKPLMMTGKPKMPGIIKEEQKIYSNATIGFQDQMSAVWRLRKDNLEKSCLGETPLHRQHLFDFSHAKSVGNFRNTRPKLIVSDQHKVIYCAIGGTGSENWESIIERLEHGEGKEEDEFDERFTGGPALRQLWSYREAAIEFRIQNYFKFMIVREPMTRLLSSYKRFVLPLDGANYSSVVQEFRHRSSATEGKSQLQAFVDFMLDGGDQYFTMEWSSYHDLCAPCSIPYNFFGRYETIKKDARYIFEKSSVKRVDYTDRHLEHTEHDFLKELRDEVSAYQLRKLVQKYKLDYALFGYTEP